MKCKYQARCQELKMPNLEYCNYDEENCDITDVMEEDRLLGIKLGEDNKLRQEVKDNSQLPQDLKDKGKGKETLVNRANSVYPDTFKDKITSPADIEENLILEIPEPHEKLIRYLAVKNKMIDYGRRLSR